MIQAQKHFHKRNLPHLYFNEGSYFITYRIKDSIPLEKLNLIRNKKFTNWDFENYKHLFEKYDSLLSENETKINILLEDEISDICKETITYPDGKDYKLICYCIMPNHIHLVIELLPGNKGISKIMQSIKRTSARKINLKLNLGGQFWQDESFDRWIRNDKELYFTIKYVLLNPVKAGLVNNWIDWNNSYCHPNYNIM